MSCGTFKSSDFLDLKLTELELKKNDILKSVLNKKTKKKIILESSILLSPNYHEGIISSCGVLFIESKPTDSSYEVIKMRKDELSTARAMANGIEWFVLYINGEFEGLARFYEKLDSERQCINNIKNKNDLIILRKKSGEVKFFSGGCIYIENHRTWIKKRSVDEYLYSIKRCYSNVDLYSIERFLKFALHGIEFGYGGEILILKMSKECRAASISSLSLNISDPHSERLISHYLTQVDGATFFDLDGSVMRLAKHLKYSDKSRKIIQEYRGTRHTSSIRYSYDHPKELVLVISKDGYYSVFISGAQVNISDQKCSKKRNNLSSIHEFVLNCKKCSRQNYLIQKNESGNEKSIIVNCKICKNPLYSSLCSEIEIVPYVVL